MEVLGPMARLLIARVHDYKSCLKTVSRRRVEKIEYKGYQFQIVSLRINTITGFQGYAGYIFGMTFSF